jgi:hypothetical protein
VIVETLMLERRGGSHRASVDSHTAVGTECGASLARSAGSSGRGPGCLPGHHNVPIGHGLWSSRSSNHSWETAQSLGDSEHVTEAAPDDAAVTDRFKRELPSSGYTRPDPTLSCRSWWQPLSRCAMEGPVQEMRW